METLSVRSRRPLEGVPPASGSPQEPSLVNYFVTHGLPKVRIQQQQQQQLLGAGSPCIFLVLVATDAVNETAFALARCLSELLS